jgi:RHS repeat-associated protein
VYDQEDMIEERDETNALKLRYVHGPGIDEPLVRKDVVNSETKHLHADGQGSITDTTGASGEVSPLYRYDSYGNVLVGSTLPGYSFTGREWDSEVQAFSYRARVYLPSVGRFASEDAVQHYFPRRANAYAYAINSPVNYVDPFGLSPRDVDLIAATFRTTVDELTTSERRHSLGWLGNIQRTIYEITGGLFGRPFLACGEQAAVLLEKLTQNTYDDNWTLSYNVMVLQAHQRLFARSGNPNDPVIILDPWNNLLFVSEELTP